MRWLWLVIGLAGVAAPAALYGQLSIPPSQLVREVVYNELHDHERHGYWRYWIEKHSPLVTRVDAQVETAEGPLTRKILENGRPLDRAGQQAEQAKLDHLLASPAEQARHRQDYADDERRIARIVSLLPDAFNYEYAGTQDGLVRLRFRPNPENPSRSVEARIFHAMSGELWISSRFKRLVRLEGHLQENVDFGFGVLGRLYKGGWFLLERTQASATDWKTARLEVHMTGRALLFKTIARETSELRGGFVAVPPGLNLAQGAALLETGELPNLPVAPVTFSSRR